VVVGRTRFSAMVVLDDVCPSTVVTSLIFDPVNTASTAASHRFHCPIQNKPCAPCVGFTNLPEASYNNDLNTAGNCDKNKLVRFLLIFEIKLNN
jgi:hypothetical protein